MSVFTADLFATGNDRDNRAAVRAVRAADLDLVGLAVYGPRNAVDKVTKGARMHPVVVSGPSAQGWPARAFRLACREHYSPNAAADRRAPRTDRGPQMEPAATTSASPVSRVKRESLELRTRRLAAARRRATALLAAVTALFVG